MPARSIVTRENLSQDFLIEAENPSGPLMLNLSDQFTRDPETGLISVDAEGGGGGGADPTTVSAGDATIDVSPVSGGYEIAVAVSADPGNQLEARDDGLFVPAAEPVAVSEDAGNQIEVRDDGLFVPAGEGGGGTEVSTDLGNQIELRDDGAYAGASAFSDLNPDIESSTVALPTAAPNEMFILPTGAETVTISASGYLLGSEYTLVKVSGPFVLSIPSGVTLNGVAGPELFDVAALPDGVVLKNVAAAVWVAMGSCVLVEV